MKNQVNEESMCTSPTLSAFLGDPLGEIEERYLEHWGKTMMGARKVTATHPWPLLRPLMALGRLGLRRDL